MIIFSSVELIYNNTSVCIVVEGKNNLNVRKLLPYAPKEDSNQPARLSYLIRDFVVRMKKKLCPFGYTKCTQRKFLSDCANAQADLNFRWAHVSVGMFSDGVAHNSFNFN